MQTINKASKLYIPAGRIPTVINAMPTEAAKKVEERDNLRAADPPDERINILNKDITRQQMITGKKNGLDT